MALGFLKWASEVWLFSWETGQAGGREQEAHLPPSLLCGRRLSAGGHKAAAAWPGCGAPQAVACSGVLWFNLVLCNVIVIISELSRCYGFIVVWIKQLSDEGLSSFRLDPRGSWLLQSPVYSISIMITPEYSKKVSVLPTRFRGRYKHYWIRLLCRERESAASW